MSGDVFVTWDQFKVMVSEHIKTNSGPRLCRGQSDSRWALRTTFHRHANGITFKDYFNIVKELADTIGTIEDRRIDASDPEINASFLAYLQHHGFPTPLLDWTMSPYIAAYFAFSGVNDQAPTSDKVSVWVFDFVKWLKRWKAVYDYNIQDSHVSVLKPKSSGNKRQVIQQGMYYLWTNVDDMASHIKHHETLQNEEYLRKYDLSVNERFNVMTELEAMGISEYSLFGTTDALCRYFREAVFRRDELGKGGLLRFVEYLKTIERHK